MCRNSAVQQEPDNRYRYNGIEHNEETGLDLAAYRSYNPAIGRWLTIDPLAEAMPSINSYRFGFNNPILWSDPQGLYESKGKAKRARRRAERLGHSVGDIYKRGDEYGFSLMNGSHAFDNTFFGGSKLGQLGYAIMDFFSNREGRRDGVELHTGLNSGGFLDAPDGTSFVIIDGILIPFGGNWTGGNSDLAKVLSWSLDQVSNWATVQDQINVIIEQGDSGKIPVSGGVFGQPASDGLDTLEIIPGGWGGGSKNELERLIFNNGYPKDTIPSKRNWSREAPDLDNSLKEGMCIGCDKPGT